MAGQFLLVVAAAIPSILSGVILGYLKNSREEAARREAELNEREMLTLKSLDALFSVTKELYEVVMQKKAPNGDLNDAYKYKEKVKHELTDYERRRAVRD